MTNNILKISFIFFLISFAIIIFTSCNSNNNNNIPSSQNDISGISLPPGFKIDIYTDQVEGAREMVLSDNNILYVGTRGTGKVYAVLDTNEDYKADKVITIARGLNSPNGVALRDGNLYVAEISKVLRYDNIDANIENVPAPFVVNDSFPSDQHHGAKFIAFGPDGKLYVPVGAPCNICNRDDDPRYASIMRMNPDGSDLEIYAHGIRNTVGFDWQPGTNELWFTDNGRDLMGDDIPSDELNYALIKGLHFGYPFVHQGDILDPEFGKGKNIDEYVKPVQKLGPHVASLGMTFYTGNMFPAEYKNQIFIAEHGSWNRSHKVGYRVMVVKVKGNKAVGYEPFAEGWLKGENVSGRPVDVLVMHDGSLLVSDDFNGVIYRISYGD